MEKASVKEYAAAKSKRGERMKKKPLLIMALTVILILVLGQTVMAFSDVANNPYGDKIKTLKEKGILSGVANDQFKPGDKLTYASGISMLVKGLELVDHNQYIQEPKASDQFPHLSDNAWYSEAFVIAFHNGLEIPENVNANDPITKEQFAHHLFQAMMTKGDYAFIDIFMEINDAVDVNNAYMNSIQKLLISKIATVDKQNNFHPTEPITRGEAAAWLHDGLKFVADTKPIEPQPELPEFEQKLSVEAVNESINKVTITAQMPHPGYGLRIASIQFDGDQAIIFTEPTLPDPDKMYPQVITEVNVSTYVDAAFKPVIPVEKDESSSSSSEVMVNK